MNSSASSIVSHSVGEATPACNLLNIIDHRHNPVRSRHVLYDLKYESSMASNIYVKFLIIINIYNLLKSNVFW